MRAGAAHLDRVIALYDPAEHRALATRFGHDVRMTAFCWRALALWMLGYPKAAAVDVEHALKDAREIGHAATSMFALSHASLARILRRDHAAAWALADELVALAEEKGSLYWKSYGLMLQGWRFRADRQSFRCGPGGHRGNRRDPVDRRDRLCPVVHVICGEGLCRARTVR